MAFNASRQPFVVSAGIGTLLATVFVARRVVAPYGLEPPEAVMPLARAMTEFSAEWPWISAVLVAALMFWTLLVVVQLSVKYAPVVGRNYLPIQIFIIATMGVAIPMEILPAMVAVWLSVLAVRQFVFSFHKDYRFEEVFRAGFYLGIVPLLYAPAMVLVLLIPAAMAIFGRSAREFAICVVGVLLPVPMAGFVHWAMGADAGFVYRELWRCCVADGGLTGIGSTDISILVTEGLLFVLAGIAIGWTLAHRKSARRRQRRVVLFLAVMLAVLTGSLLVPGASVVHTMLLAVPLTLCVPYAFPDKNTAVASSVVHYVVLAAAFAMTLSRISGFSVP